MEVMGSSLQAFSDFDFIQDRVMQWDFDKIRGRRHSLDVIGIPAPCDLEDPRGTRWLEPAEERRAHKVRLEWIKTLEDTTSVGVDASIARIESELVYLIFGRCGYVFDTQKLDPDRRVNEGRIVVRDLFEYLFDRDLAPSVGRKTFFPVEGETSDLGHIIRLIDTQLQSLAVLYLVQNYGADVNLLYVDGDWLASRKRGYTRIGDISIDLSRLVHEILAKGINYWHLVKNPTARTFVAKQPQLHKKFSSDTAYFNRVLPEGFRSPAFYEKDRSLPRHLQRVQIYVKSRRYPMMRLETLTALWDSWSPRERERNLEIALAQILKNSWQLPLVIELTHDYVHIHQVERIGWMMGLKTLFERYGLRFELKLRALNEVLNYERHAATAGRMGD